MMKLDLHVHTGRSCDSYGSLEALAKRVRKLGITPAITDHDTVDAHAGLRKLGLEFIPGEEVTSLQGDVIGLYVTERIPGKIPYLEAVDRIREQGGLVYVPHMYDPRRSGVNDGALARRADIIEAYNGKCFGACNRKAGEFAKKEGKPMGAGSDSHFVFEIGRTYVETPDFDIGEPRELLKALREGRIVGGRGVFIPGLPAMMKVVKGIFGNGD